MYCTNRTRLLEDNGSPVRGFSLWESRLVMPWPMSSDSHTLAHATHVTEHHTQRHTQCQSVPTDVQASHGVTAPQTAQSRLAAGRARGQRLPAWRARGPGKPCVAWLEASSQAGLPHHPHQSPGLWEALTGSGKGCDPWLSPRDCCAALRGE